MSDIATELYGYSLLVEGTACRWKLSSGNLYTLYRLAQLVGALHRNRRAAGSIPATPGLIKYILRSNKIYIYIFPLNDFHLQYPSTIIESKTKS